MRYYYKSKDGKSYLDFKTPLPNEELENYVVITQEEFNTHMGSIKSYAPSKEEIAKQRKINEARNYLNSTDYVVIKIAEADTEELRNSLREEYAKVIAKRKTCRETINKLDK